MDGANYIFSTETMCVFTMCVFLHAANLESHRRKQNKKNKTKNKTKKNKTKNARHTRATNHVTNHVICWKLKTKTSYFRGIATSSAAFLYRRRRVFIFSPMRRVFFFSWAWSRRIRRDGQPLSCSHGGYGGCLRRTPVLIGGTEAASSL